MTDRRLAQAIIDLKIPRFGPNQKNKSDSPSCLFRPRRLLSSPEILSHVGQEIARVVLEKCSSQTIVGLATSGIPWAAIAAEKAGLPMLFVRKSIEPVESNDMLEGVIPKDNRVVLVDDLLFVGDSKRKAV
ncbi:MAG: phosphoribosyltransferase family protein, partial [Pirellulales bacterium]